MPIEGMLVDLSGVFYVGGDVLPGAREALLRLRQMNKPFRFVTNTSRKCRAEVVSRLHVMGLDVEPHEVLTAPLAGRHWIETRGLRPHLLVHPELLPDFVGIKTSPANAVFMGDAGETFSYDNLNAAFRVLQTGAPLVAVARNRYFQESDGLSLDLGPFVAALEFATRTKAVIVGKPSAEFYTAAVESMALDPREVIMVGDDLEADVLGALDAGLRAALVRTGKYRESDEASLQGTAAMVFDNVYEMLLNIYI
jgi:HAD superfamily hydrolase (TIGR01458 family)